jgi:IS1 family transposase
LFALQQIIQAALEKMGKTENTVEPEFLKKQTALLEQHNATLSTTSKAIAKQSKQVFFFFFFVDFVVFVFVFVSS